MASRGISSKVKSYLSMWRRIIDLSRRPSDDEFKLLLKLNILGFFLVGGIAYIIHLITVLTGR